MLGRKPTVPALRKSHNDWLPAIFFSEFSIFHVGIKDLKPRTGNWRVLQTLFTINLVVWVAVLILHWLGLGSLGLGSRDLLSIAFLVTLFYSVFSLAYLHLYRMPRKRVPRARPETHWDL